MTTLRASCLAGWVKLTHLRLPSARTVISTNVIVGISTLLAYLCENCGVGVTLENPLQRTVRRQLEAR